MSSITGEVKHGKECSLSPAGIVELYLREQGGTYGVVGRSPWWKVRSKEIETE